MHLTDKTIRGLNCSPGKSQRVESDTGPGGKRGLQIVVSNYRKYFRVRSKVDGKTRYRTIGDYPGLSLGRARELFDRERLKLRDEWAPDHDVERITVRELVQEWHDKDLVRNRKHPSEALRTLELDLLPLVGNLEARSVSRRQLVTALDRPADRGALRSAERLRAEIRQLFRFAVGRGIIASSPAEQLPAVRRGKRPTRSRVLDDDEIRRFWYGLTMRDEPDAKQCPAALRDYLHKTNRLPIYTRTALKLLLLTGVRRSELILAEWAEFDLDRRVWTIPGERTKNGEQHVVPLTDTTLMLLEAQLQLTGGRRWVFASPRKNLKEPILPSALSQAVADNFAKLGIEKFVAHDLRRTLRSRLPSLGVDHVVSRKVVNHSLQGMDQIYDRHSYLREKRDALKKWDHELQRILTSSEAKP